MKLIDGQERNREHPETFYIPKASEIARLRVGDFVKIGFDFTDGSGERIWARLTYVGSDFLGELDNDPVHRQLKLGQEVRFEACNILDVLHSPKMKRKES